MKIAIIGASNDKTKYSNKIILNLKDKNHIIFPINPKETSIEGLSVYKNLQEINDNIDIIVFVIRAEIGLDILQTTPKNILEQSKIWFQPGRESEEIINFCKQNNLDYIANACIMIDSLKNL